MHGVAISAHAGNTDGAVAAVERIHAITASASRASAGRRAALISAALDTYLDLDALAAKILGQAWRDASAAERRDFKLVLRDIIARDLAHRIRPTDRFVIFGAKALNDRDIVVFSRVGHMGQNSKRLDWKMRPCGNSYCIYDLVSSGASLSIARRDDYAPRLRSAGGSLDVLTRSLRAELDAKQ